MIVPGHIPDSLFINDQAKLHDLCATLSKPKLIAIDTEFVRESTYFAKLCLIQIATDELIACIDCLAPIDMQPLFEQLLSANVTLVAHSGRQDIEVIWQKAGALPLRMLDTQIAAGLLGYPPQIGLRELLIEIVGVEIEKSMARTDWTKRPLSQNALAYALSDVEYLLDMWSKLERRLIQAGRLDWFEEDCQRALNVDLSPNLVQIFQRTKGAGRLRGIQINTALALLKWRENRAEEVNRPRRWILADEVIVALAQTKPSNLAELQNVPGISAKSAEKLEAALLPLINGQHDSTLDELAAACAPSQRPNASQLKLLQAHVREAAMALDIEPEVIAAKRDLVATVLNETPQHLRTGWRAAALAAYVPDKHAGD